ncbi:MAG: tyrosine-protein phosphatase [Thermoleophilaceae bacterium]
MIDLHAHVLPGIDDGPPELEASIELLRAAAADGTRTIAATPHLRHDFPKVEVRDLAEGCRRVRDAMPPDVGIELVQAAEVDLVWSHGAGPEELRLASYAQRGHDLLVETPYGGLGENFETMLSRLRVQGYRVLLAHPELNASFQRDPGRLARLVAQGTLVQLTAASLTRPDRKSRSCRLARRLVEDGLAHVLASDSHSAGPFRPPGLSAAVLAAAQLDPGRAEWMVTEAPAAILAGEQLEQPSRGRLRGIGRLARLRRRLARR